MTLQQFLSKFEGATTVVDIIDKASSNLIISMQAGGYTALEDTLEAKTVDAWSIVVSGQTVKLKVVVAGE